MPNVSVIISTYNGAHKIRALLDALLEQTYSDFETIVVVDGSTDDTLNVLYSYSKQFKDFRIITQPNAGRSKVRNRGAHEASGSLLIFYDDDMSPSFNSVQQHYDFFSKHRSAVLGGNQIEMAEEGKSDIQNYKAWLTKRWTAKYSEVITRLTIDNLFFTAANCSIPKHIFSQLNGFDDRLTDSEDYDFALRALRSGVDVYFDKNNQAIHRDKITCKSYVKRLREYANAKTELTRLQGTSELSQGSHSSLKRMIYRLFALPLWVRLIDDGYFVPIFPKVLRYRLYSVIIQSLAHEYPSVRL